MELVKALTEISSLFSNSQNETELLHVLVERVCYETGSDLVVLYTREEGNFIPRLVNRGEPSDYPLLGEGDFLSFIDECGDYIVSHGGTDGPFASLFVGDHMNSAASCPLIINREITHFLILNGKSDYHYNQEKLTFLESACQIAQSGLAHFQG